MVGGHSAEYIDLDFMNLAVSYYESSYVYIDYILDEKGSVKFGVLNVLHSMFIGLELSLKAILSAYKEINVEEWMIINHDITIGHNLHFLVDEIKKQDEKFSDKALDNDTSIWLKNRIEVFEKFIEFTSNEGLNFESTRYPIKKNNEPQKYVDSEVYVNLNHLKK